MSLMSLCHKPFVYKGWASDIKWHYRPKSDIKLSIHLFFAFFRYYDIYAIHIFYTDWVLLNIVFSRIRFIENIPAKLTKKL